MKPTLKSKEVDAFITKTTGIDRQKTITENKCATCTTPNLDFRDVLSQREYTISGMCQNCQDEIFGK